MTTTDTHDLIVNAIWNAANGRPIPFNPDDLAAAVLPIVAEEVRKAKAEAWAEGWDHRNTPDGYAWDGEQDVPLVSSRYDNPYCETGDSDEHR